MVDLLWELIACTRPAFFAVRPVLPRLALLLLIVTTRAFGRLVVRLRPDWLPADRRVVRVWRDPAARARRLRPREVPVPRARAAPTARDRDLRLLDLRPL